MAQVISIEELEAVINELRRTTAPVGRGLSPALCVLAEIYGVMIYSRARSVDVDGLAEEARQEICRWFRSPAAPGPSTGTGDAVLAQPARSPVSAA